MGGPDRRLLGRVQETVVDHGVVGAVDEQCLAVDPEPRRARHRGAQRLDVVAAVDLDRRAVLGADHDGLGGAVPVAAEVVAQVVEPGRARFVVAEPELRRQLRRDVDQPVLGQDHGRADVLDMRVAQADQQDLGILVAFAVCCGVELRVAGDVEALAFDLVDRLSVLVVRRHGGRETVERLIERVLASAATGQQADDERQDGRERQARHDARGAPARQVDVDSHALSLSWS